MNRRYENNNCKEAIKTIFTISQFGNCNIFVCETVILFKLENED